MNTIFKYLRGLFGNNEQIIICKNNKNSKITVNGKVIFDDTKDPWISESQIPKPISMDNVYSKWFKINTQTNYYK